MSDNYQAIYDAVRSRISERAEQIAIMCQRDDQDGWQYRVEARGSWYAIAVFDEDGIKLGDL